MTRKSVRPYREPAGGWGALKALSEALLEQGVPVKGAATLSRMNQPQGFDCPGCAWPDPKHTSSFEFAKTAARRSPGRRRPGAVRRSSLPGIPSPSCRAGANDLEMV